MRATLGGSWKQSNNVAKFQNILETSALEFPSGANYKLLKEINPISSEANK